LRAPLGIARSEATKQSTLRYQRSGLLRFARNDDEGVLLGAHSLDGRVNDSIFNFSNSHSLAASPSRDAKRARVVASVTPSR
jgi:hypothetical protein